MAWPKHHKYHRHHRGGKHGRKVAAHQRHRRSGATRKLSRRVQGKLFRGRVVNAPRHF